MNKLRDIIGIALFVGIAIIVVLITMFVTGTELTPTLEYIGYFGTFLVCASIILSSLFPNKPLKYKQP